ncbi:hypothetical protein F4781DRAFT_303226 [Annulohypoxylon bovei var. microspora]|nr:hypothetical protein F4781DRAFT_303226 [Annulohypoxylon bovei var. microspora]
MTLNTYPPEIYLASLPCLITLVLSSPCQSTLTCTRHSPCLIKSGNPNNAAPPFCHSVYTHTYNTLLTYTLQGQGTLLSYFQCNQVASSYV